MFDVSPAGVRRLIVEGEGPTVEFKTQFVMDRVIARIVVAFANSMGGIILFGVADNANVLGLTKEEEDYTVNRLKRLAAALLPVSLYRIGTVDIDGKTIVYITVDEAPESTRPIRLATGEALERRGSAVVEMRSEQAKPETSRQVSAFVAMSFRTEEEPALVDYFEAMKRAVGSVALPIKLIKMDQLEGDYEISQKIMDEIDKAEIVVADFTLSPANVYFEVGYARGRKCRIIQTAKKGTILEFDTKNWRTIFYKNATELEAALGPALEQAYRDVTTKTSEPTGTPA
jgi:hypothetical protein